MKVYFYCADITFTGGIEKITSTLANCFVNKGMEVIIVSNFRTNNKYSYELDSRVQTIFLSDFPYAGSPGSLKRLKMFLKNRKRVKDYFKNVHGQLIITQGFPTAFSYFIAMGKRNKNHIINCEHVHYFYYGIFVRILRYLVYKRYNNVCVLTKTDKQRYDKLNINATCIPNAVPVLNYKPDNFISRDKTILGIGRLEEQKNFSSLINVFAKVHEIHPDWNLEIYGSGNLKEDLQSLIEKLNLGNCARLMGVSKTINEVFQKSAIFVLSSLFEGFPMVLVEAMSNGCPVVSYDCPNGPADLIENEKNGLLVEYQNEENLFKSICRMIDEPDFRDSCASNAMETVKQYSIDNIFCMWKQLFLKSGADYE